MIYVISQTILTVMHMEYEEYVRQNQLLWKNNF